MNCKHLKIALAALVLSAGLPVRGAIIHRYSFTSDANDSVGTANGTLMGSATITGNAVVLNGADSYVDLPNDLVSNLTAITIETWVTDNGSAGWARVYDFGTSSGGEDQQGGGLTYLFLSLPDGGGSLRNAYNAGAGEQLVTAARPPSGQPAHIVWTSDGASATGALYVDGVRMEINTNMTITPVTIGHTFNDWLGRSQYNDPYFSGSIDEFRIYDAAVSPLQAAVDAVLGPNTLYSDPGVPTALRLNVATNKMNVGEVQKATVSGDFASVSNVNLTTAVAYSSSDANVVAVLDSTGRIGATGAGTAAVFAVLSGVTNSQTITVTAVPPKMLHRYSFTADANDSVGTANGTLAGGASIVTNALVLDGASGYVDLPNDLFTNLASVTFEAWTTDYGSAGWARIYDFGNSTGGEDQQGGGTRYMFLSLPSGFANLRGAYTIGGGGAPEQIVEWPNGARPPVGQEAHVVWTSDAISHTGRLYVNGVQVAANTNVTLTPADIGPTVNDWLGRSQFNDPYYNGAIDEFRIYDTALGPLQVAVDAAAGPDNIITNTGTIQSLSLSVNSNMTVGTFQSATVAASFANVTNVNVSSLASYASGNTNVVTVDSSGVIKAVGVGSATLSASYSGLTKSATITVVLKPIVLAHRYSFTTDAGDSAGTANGSLVGSAAINSGAVVLDGASAVRLPAGLIDNTYEAVTIEAWANVNIISDGLVAHLYGFGGTNSSGAAQSFIRLRTHSAGNNSAPGINSGGGEQTTFIPGPVAGAIHVVVINNPAAGYLQWYLNGHLANSNAVTALLTGIRGTNNTSNLIGQHVDGAGGMIGTIDEFRIYNGALNLAQLRTSLAAGPNNPVFDAGTIQSVTVAVYPNFINGTIQRPQVHASSATVSGIDLTGVAEVTFASGNPNVLAVLPGGTVQAIGVGTATLTATYQGVSSNTSVTVIAQQTMLTHRYSFTNDASDSVGGASGALRGNATISNGALTLANDPTGASGRGSYLELPSDLIDGYQAVTVEAWVNLDVNGLWPRIFDFGNYNSGGGGDSYLFVSPHTGGAGTRLAIKSAGVAGEELVDLGGTVGPLDSTGLRHVVAVVDPAQQHLGALYLDGVSAGSSTFTKPLSTIDDVHNFVGRSMYTGDTFLNGAVDEFRIYHGALTASQVATNFAAGPNVVVPVQPPLPSLNGSLSGSNLVLAWPDTATAFVLESSDALGAAASWNPVGGTPNDINGTFTLTIPTSGSAAKFFRLRK